MNRLLIFLGVVVIACGLLFIPSLLELGPNKENGDTKKDSRLVKEIKSDISRLSERDWDKQLYDSLSTAIQAAYSMKNITSSSKTSLKNLLDYEYIPTLVQASKNFVRYSCNDRTLMVKLNGELKRYKNQNVDPRQRKLVTDVKSWMTDIYMVAGYTTSYDSRRKGLDGEILRYTTGSLFDLDQTKMYSDTLDTYAQNPSIENCDMVKTAVAENRNRLSIQYYDMVYSQVRNYVDTHAFDKELTSGFRKEIKEYGSNNILRNTSQTRANEQKLIKMLDDHYLANRNR